MKKTKKNLLTELSNTSLGLIAMGLFSTLSTSFADYPQWWLDQGVVNTNAVATNDYAAVNQGQLKHMASAAYGDIASRYSQLNTTSLSNLVSGFSNSDNYAAVNLGQLKYVSMQFYDFLWANNLTNAWPEGMTSSPYPWTSTAGTVNDYALVNLGQLKYVFSFDFNGISLGTNVDSDGDFSPDWREALDGTNPYDSFD